LVREKEVLKICIVIFEEKKHNKKELKMEGIHNIMESKDKRIEME